MVPALALCRAPCAEPRVGAGAVGPAQGHACSCEPGWSPRDGAPAAGETLPQPTSEGGVGRGGCRRPRHGASTSPAGAPRVGVSQADCLPVAHTVTGRGFRGGGSRGGTGIPLGRRPRRSRSGTGQGSSMCVLARTGAFFLLKCILPSRCQSRNKSHPRKAGAENSIRKLQQAVIKGTSYERTKEHTLTRTPSHPSPELDVKDEGSRSASGLPS